MKPEWFNSVASNILNDFDPSNRLNGDEYGELATAIARALLEVHQCGMKEASNHIAELEKEIGYLREMAYS